MTTFVFSNNASTTLAGPIAATATTINVAAGTGALFPSPAVGQQFSVTLVSATDDNVREITYCTSRVGDTLSVLRGQESTTPTAFNAGDTAANDLTAGACASFLQIIPTPPPTPTPTPTPPPPQAFLNYYGTDVGSPNSIRVTLNPQQPGSLALLIGSPILILVANTNTGSTILTITGLPSTTVFAQGGSTSSLPSGSIVGGQIYQFTYLSGVGFEVSTPKVLLSTQNTWTASQTMGNSLAWRGNNTSGVPQSLIGVDSNNQTVTFAGPSGGAAWRIANNIGSANLLTVGSTGAVQTAGGITVSTGGLNITGNSTFQNNVTTGSLTVNGTTEITGIAQIGGTLGVGGAITAGLGASIFAGTVTVAGNGTFQNNVTTGSLTVTGTSHLTGVAQIGGTLGVGGAITAGTGTTNSGDPFRVPVLADFGGTSVSGGFYITIPSYGLFASDSVTIQIGEINAPANNTQVTYSFVRPFSSQCLGMVISYGGAIPPANGNIGAQPLNPSQFVATNTSTAGGVNGCTYIAIGF